MRQKHVIRYLERLAVDDETAVELILQKVQLILGLFSRLDYIQNEVSTSYYGTNEKYLTLGDLVNVLIACD